MDANGPYYVRSDEQPQGAMCEGITPENNPDRFPSYLGNHYGVQLSQAQRNLFREMGDLNSNYNNCEQPRGPYNSWFTQAAPLGHHPQNSQFCTTPWTNSYYSPYHPTSSPYYPCQ